MYYSHIVCFLWFFWGKFLTISKCVAMREAELEKCWAVSASRPRSGSWNTTRAQSSFHDPKNTWYQQSKLSNDDYRIWHQNSEGLCASVSDNWWWNLSRQIIRGASQHQSVSISCLSIAKYHRPQATNNAGLKKNDRLTALWTFGWFHSYSVQVAESEKTQLQQVAAKHQTFITSTRASCKLLKCVQMDAIAIYSISGVKHVNWKGNSTCNSNFNTLSNTPQMRESRYKKTTQT